jgi:hypothetical protein
MQEHNRSGPEAPSSGPLMRAWRAIDGRLAAYVPSAKWRVAVVVAVALIVAGFATGVVRTTGGTNRSPDYEAGFSCGQAAAAVQANSSPQGSPAHEGAAVLEACRREAHKLGVTSMRDFGDGVVAGYNEGPGQR